MIARTSEYYAVKTVITSVVILSLCCLTTGRADDIISLSEPAANWEKEAFPLGNGRLGCMVFGGIEEERIQFNVDSLWTGDENLTGDYRAPGIGFYQNFGNLYVAFDARSPPTEYRRELNIRKAVCRVIYQQDHTKFVRETFCSHPDQVLVSRMTARGTCQQSPIGTT